MSLFAADHLANLAEIFVKACTLDENHMTAPPKTMVGRVHGEADVTTSEGVVVVHSAFVGDGGGLLHFVTLASHRVDVADLVALARFLQDALEVGGNVDGRTSPSRAVFTLTAPNVERERAFQARLRTLPESDALWNAIARIDVSSPT